MVSPGLSSTLAELGGDMTLMVPVLAQPQVSSLQRMGARAARGRDRAEGEQRRRGIALLNHVYRTT